MLTPNQHQESSGESRIEKMRKFLSSPLTRKKPSTMQYKTFGIPLEVLLQRSPSEHSVPFVITRLCQYILKTGLSHEGLFRISGNARSVERLKVSFDRSGDAPLETEGDVSSAAALLKLFLRELPDPIVPLNMHCHFLNAVKDKDKAEGIAGLAELVEKLPPVNYDILNYLFSFLKKVSAMEEQNRMSASSLGIVFGPNLFRVSEDLVGLKEQSYTNQIVTYFISDHDKIFRKETGTYTFRTCFSSQMNPGNQVTAMVASWPEVKGSSSLMSTWSLGPLSSQNESSDDFMSLTALSHSITSSDPYSLLKCQEQYSSAKNDTRLSTSDFPDYSTSVSESSISANHSSLPSLKGCLGRRNSLKDYFIMDEEPILYHSSLWDKLPSLSQYSCLNYQSDKNISSKDFSHEVNNIDSHDDSCYGKDLQHTSSEHHIKFHDKTEEVLSDTHKVYPRGRRRHAHRNRAEERRTHSEFRTKACTHDEDEFNGNHSLSVYDKMDPHHNSTGSLDDSGVDIRHSWPVFRKSREDDIALSPLPQQLGINPSDEASISPSAFRSYLSHRTLHLDPNLPPSPPVEQEDIVIGGSIDSPSSTVKQLTRKIHTLKKKIKVFEDNFEKLYGYMPSNEEKCSNISVKKMIAELNKARQDLKDPLIWDSEETNKTSVGVNTRSSQCLFSLPNTSIGNTTIEDTVMNSLAFLTKHRSDMKRPQNIEEMNKEQLGEEKMDLQKVLLNFESMHGRPALKEHRDLVRPLYDRYRGTKRLIAKENADLMPILEHETMDFIQEDKLLDVVEKAVIKAEVIAEPSAKQEATELLPSTSSHINFHELPPYELEAQLNEVKEEKRRLRKILRDFEDQFKKDHGRKVQREDKRSMETHYNQYKNIKAKLKLLEALVAKHDQIS